MKTGWKKGLALGLTVCIAAASLAGCGKKKGLDESLTVATLDGEKVSAGVVNFMLRYQQSSFENSYGAFLKSYYGDDIWNSDLTGTGVAYGESFKEQMMDAIEEMLLAEKHMEEYGVELTDDEKAAITAAAEAFRAANSEETLEQMSASQENVERILTLYTIRDKMDDAMTADVDTEVSDEEAAQRTVAYVRFVAASPEDDEEAAETDTEAETGDAQEETATEAETEEADADAETAETDTEETTDAAQETSEAELTEDESDKTESADTEAETAAETETEDVEDAAETEEESAEEETAAESEETTEAEPETEDPAVTAAKEEAKARAEAFLAVAREAEDFEAAAEEAAENDSNAYSNTYTFGSNDTYPSAEIIAATEGLEDNTLVEEVIEASDAFYVLYVTDAFNEEATEEEKESIVEQRKQDAINALYEQWEEEADFSVDQAVYANMLFNIAFQAETEVSTESTSEDSTETAEASETEAAEDGTEAAETEAAEDSTETAETEAAEDSTEAAETAETEAVTETAVETETETAAE